MYEIVIERDSEHFRAYCPALPGIEAVGESKEAVIERMYEIIPAHLNETKP